MIIERVVLLRSIWFRTTYSKDFRGTGTQLMNSFYNFKASVATF